MTEIKNYYEVIAKCGHVGRKQYVPIKFAIVAEDGKEAAKIVRQFPRVKHNHKDAILNVNKIDFERYVEIIEINNNDPYLKCHSKQEQRLINNLEKRLETDFHSQEVKYDKKTRLDRITYKKKKIKILEKLYLEGLDYAYAY
ncbi:MAG: hypothetical protein MR766_00295 [Erysipelotrichaceae bacterium]|nr:hypothetical protein [Erysipelotrichaceae bacterium]